MTRLTVLLITLMFLSSCNNATKEDSVKNEKQDSTHVAKQPNGIHICVDRLPCEFPNPDGTKPAGGLNSKVWKNLSKNSFGKQIINVRFLEGSEYLKNKVIQYARQWEPIANIEFKFYDISNDPNSDPEIKITFREGDGSWSYLGNDSKYFSPSMNYGWFDNFTPDEEFSRVILHEFGHALSLIHEHQNPRNNPINWNKESVYKYFSGSPNFWSKKEIDENLFSKYSIDQINGSSFDPNSIMLYGFPATLTLDGKGTKDNATLSELDKKVVKSLYK